MKLFPKTIFAALLAAALLISCAAGCTASAPSASSVPPAQDAQGSGAGIPASPPAAVPGGEPDTALHTGNASPGPAFSGSKQLPIRYLGEGMALGDGNKAGYYYLSHREDASFNIKHVDYASCTEIYLCSRPECTHDNESCAAWRPYCGSEGSAIPIGENLYLLFCGSATPADHVRYGELAKLHIEKAGLDGSDARQLVSLPFQMDLSRYEDIRPSGYALANYAMVLLYEAEQPEQHGLISLESGKIFLLTMEIEAPEEAHNRTVPLFAEINGEAFLTAKAFSHKTVLFPLAGGGTLGLLDTEYELALLPVESCLANRADFVPIRRLEP